ncbi:MAG: hypothetical protein ABSB01_05105 [Streptosporangiaceae bacterium]|jgi:hypothetical protein
MYALSALRASVASAGQRRTVLAPRPAARSRVAAPPGLTALAGCAVLAASLVLAGCGSVTAPATTGPATTGPATTGPATTGLATTGPATAASAKATAGQPELCAGIGRVNRLVILRSRGMNRIQELHFPFPEQVIVANAAAARALARAVCALPGMPRGVVNCPALLLGTSYQLTFSARGLELPVVTVQATGCETVTGAGPVRRATDAAGFWQLLGRTMGLFAPRVPVFRGDGPAES